MLAQGAAIPDGRSPPLQAQRSCPYSFFAFTSRRAAGDRRLQARRAARAPQPACQGCARYCAVGALDILRGCAARRSLPEERIADLSLMITSAPNENFVRRPQTTAPGGGRQPQMRITPTIPEGKNRVKEVPSVD